MTPAADELEQFLGRCAVNDDEIERIGTHRVAKSQGTVDPQAALPHDISFRREAVKHRTRHLLQVANAAKHLRELPAAGESLHCVMRGNYNAWDLVPATLRLAAPATIAALHVATLGFNGRNAVELCELLDAGAVGSATFLCSHYFEKTTPDVFGYLAAELARRDQRILAMRSHAKIILMRLSDGRHYTIEGSANLRSCRNIEQFCMTNDRGLMEFHRTWIEQMFPPRG